MNETSLHLADQAARSPWSASHQQAHIQLTPAAEPIDQTINVSGSKSLTNRALIIAAMANGTSRLDGILKSDDSYWCIDSLKKLGVSITIDQTTATVTGVGGKWPVEQEELYVGAAGTVARFLPGALAAGNGTWLLDGSRRMQERPLAPLLGALSALGAQIDYTGQPGCLPLILRANGLKGGEVTISGSVSSQFISGLLLAAPYAKDPLIVHIDGTVVQRDYVDMTLEMMRAFGVEPLVQNGGQSVRFEPATYKAAALTLEPDVSTCGYFWSLAALTNGRIRINGISTATRQPDIELLDTLERLGCTVVRGDDFVEVRGTAQLKGGFTVSMKRWSDQTLTMAALATFADAPITMTDAAHIRHHECDRISVVCEQLHKLGIKVEEYADGLTVHPGPVTPALLDPHDDHRMAMALALIGAKIPGIRIADPGCVAKTCPDYFVRLSDLGIGVE
ncbi:UNVERIFIED_CONTAM: 3-phosphoshikimate 1-carboxyvinyltransferase [Brevibacillus sp. OAP136]